MAFGDWSWLLAVALAACAALVSNLGLNLQKLHHLRNEGSSETVKNTYYKHRLWRAGMGLIVLGSCCDFSALTFGPQSLIAPLGSLTLVFNIVFAPLVLNERFSVSDIVSTSVIFVGSVCSVLFGSHKNHIQSIDNLFRLYQRPLFACYILSVVSVCSLLRLVIHKLNQKANQADLIGNPDLHAPYRGLHRVCYPLVAGVAGGQTVLFAKCVGELLVNTVQGKGSMFTRGESYLIVGAMLTSCLFQVKWLNEGLMRFDAAYMVPVFTSCWILVSVLAGMLFYNEFDGLDVEHLELFTLGIVISGVGIASLSRREVRPGGFHKLQPLASEGVELESTSCGTFDGAEDVYVIE